MHTDIQQKVVSRLFPAFLIAFMAAALGCTEAKPMITLEKARAELSTKSANEGLVYLTIRNEGGPDAIKGVKTTIPEATADILIMTGSEMVRTDLLPIAAKSTVDLNPGNSALVISNLPHGTKEGYQFTVTLVFEKSGEKTLSLVFRTTQKHSMTEGEGKNMTPRD